MQELYKKIGRLDSIPALGLSFFGLYSPKKLACGWQKSLPKGPHFTESLQIHLPRDGKIFLRCTQKIFFFCTYCPKKCIPSFYFNATHQLLIHQRGGRQTTKPGLGKKCTESDRKVQKSRKDTQNHANGIGFKGIIWKYEENCLFKKAKCKKK